MLETHGEPVAQCENYKTRHTVPIANLSWCAVT